MPMDKGEERFPEKLAGKDPFYEDLPLTELEIDVDKALKATKPNENVVDFKRYPKTRENEDLKVVMEKEEQKVVEHKQKKEEAKEKFKVDKLFPKK